ncbi:tyrosine-type recombinase/integrase [Ralstonia solanacearum]|uniref:Tyrosine-type recombinase/integrase n=1 Tax=Ralstonia solanacearum TaxID=305 RepID=A0AAW5ZV38_RALSL|nr:site-specific integrase [Ralstonia solanacearum]MDB0573090.1 tyrosine-type recombinase/integrase [Ralstonia solanacearum]
MSARNGRAIHRLAAPRVAKVSTPGYHADGAGLYLQVSKAGTKSWIFRYKLDGRAREMGLGPLHSIGLADARERAANCRKQLLEGIDPIEARNAKRMAQRLEAARSMTFSACADSYIETHRAGWKNAKHVAQWQSTLKTYADPVFGSLPVQDIDTNHVMRVLEPIWHAKPETASRLRGRIAAILDWATVRGLRQGLNPARWQGHLDSLLPSRTRVRAVEHHPALPFDELGTFLKELREQSGCAASALEFLIVTAARTNEVIGAQWDEFDLEQKVWVCPASRMKGKREHRVPLSEQAMTVLTRMGQDRTSIYVFPGAKADKPLSNMAMLALLKRMGRADLTCHGFRSTFRDWAAERTNFAREVAEAALAHIVGDKVEAAYRRGDLFDKRRQLMGHWGKFGAVSLPRNKSVVAMAA